MGSNIYTDLPEPGTRGISSMEVAEKEFRERKMPLKLKRAHADDSYEYWSM